MKNDNTYCVIMAGGVGSRFYPLSRQGMPKQFLDILGMGKSLLRMAYERMLPIVPADKFTVVTNIRYKSLVEQQIPELAPEQILCEPVGRNTAPCICYAAYKLRSTNPDAKMIAVPSDHIILDTACFEKVVGECLDFIDTHEALMTIGINPSRPETGYGYIQASDPSCISRVKSFTEKPDLELAQTFVQCGEFFWNSGIFIWKVRDIIAAAHKHLPEYAACFDEIESDYNTPREADSIARVFAECRPVSVDYGIMEKTDKAYVRCADFGWSDLGTWGALYRHSRKDAFANAKPEKGCYTYNTRNCIISLPKGKIAAISGLKEFIVVDTDDVLMICPRSEEQNIKKFIDEVKYSDGSEHI